MKTAGKLIIAVSVLTVWTVLAQPPASERGAAEAPDDPPREEVAPVEPQMPPQTPGAPAELTEAQRLAAPLVKDGQYQSRVGNNELAIEAFRQALIHDPDNFWAKFGLGTAYINAKQYATAEQTLKDLVARYPDNYFAVNNLAWLYATAEDLSIRDGDKAVRHAQEALLRGPQDYHVWSTLAEAYYVSGKFDKALRASEVALKHALEQTQDLSIRQDYLRQYRKCQEAAQTMDIMEK